MSEYNPWAPVRRTLLSIVVLAAVVVVIVWLV